MTDRNPTPIKLEPLQTLEGQFDIPSSNPLIPFWQKRQDTFLQRVEVEEHCVKIAEESLQSLKEQLHTYADKIRSSMTWIDRIDRINAQKKKCRVTIGFVGATGTGKSTLISALVGQRDLVPSDDEDACTSVIVELLWNPKNDEDSKFEGRIQFADPQQWQEDLEMLYSDVAAEKVQDEDEGGELDPELSHRIDEMMSKVKAVYPSIKGKADLTKTTVAKLMAHENVACLGKERVIIHARQRKFSSEIRPFIDSKAGQGMKFALWPLVKLVQIFTKSELLRDAIVLVDIPGNSDSNAARDSLAKSYMQKLSVTCVLSRASRASADKGAQDLIMSRATERTMQLDGIWNSDKLCFLVARTDESLVTGRYIDTHPDLAQNLIESLECQSEKQEEQTRIRQDIASCKLEIRDNKETRDQLQQELRKRTIDVGYDGMPDSKKRKFTHDDGNDESLTEPEKQVAPATRALRAKLRTKNREIQDNEKLLQQNEETLSRINDELGEVESTLKAACIKYRNKSAERAIKANFERGAEEIGLDHNGKPLNVFCVSALMYLNSLDGKRDCGFPGDVETGIPALRRWLIETTLESRHHNAKSYLTHAGKLEEAIKSFAGNSSDDHKMSYQQRQEVEHGFDKETRGFLKSFSSLSSSCGTQLQTTYDENIQKTIVKIEKTINRNANLLVKNFAKHPMHWSTYRAIAASRGAFKSSKRIAYNWNGDLAGIYLDPLVAPWNQVFCFELSNLRNYYDEEALKRLSKFADDIIASAENACPLIGDTLGPVHQSILQMKDSLEDNSRKIFQEFILDKAKDIHRLVEPSILESMSPGYIACGSIRGYETFTRMQATLRVHTEKKGKTMYKSCGKVIGAAVTDLVCQTSKHLDEGPETAVREINELLKLMLDDQTMDSASAELSPSQSLAKINLQKDIHEIFQAMFTSFEEDIQLTIEENLEELEIPVVDLVDDGSDSC